MMFKLFTLSTVPWNQFKPLSPPKGKQEQKPTPYGTLTLRKKTSAKRQGYSPNETNRCRKSTAWLLISALLDVATALLHTNQGKYKHSHIYSLPTTLMLSKNQIATIVWQSASAASLIIWMIDITLLRDILQWNHYTLPTLLIWLSIIAYVPELLRLVATDKSKVTSNQPLDELVNFIVDNNWLPVTKAKEKFWRTNEKCKEIGDKLEKRGILARGKDNARVLAEPDPQVIEFGLNTEHYSPDSRVLYS